MDNTLRKEIINFFKSLPILNKSSYSEIKDSITEKCKIYGWYVNPNEEDPYKAITYLKDAKNKESTKMYRQVEYLKSTGTQYILTDIIPFNTTKIKLDMQFGDFHEYPNASTYNSHFCGVAEFGGDTTSEAFWGVALNETSGSTYFDFYLGNVSWQESANHISNPANITTRQTMQICRGNSYWGNQTALVNTAVTKAEPTKPLAIMGFNCVDRPNFSSNPYKCRDLIIYGVKIYINGSDLSHNLIPVERSYDKELGLYDTITNKFYTNTGTGTFEKGSYVDNSIFDYGDWKNMFFMPKPCMLKSNGTVDYYLDENDYSKKKDYTSVESTLDVIQGSYGYWPYTAGTAPVYDSATDRGALRNNTPLYIRPHSTVTITTNKDDIGIAVVEVDSQQKFVSMLNGYFLPSFSITNSSDSPRYLSLRFAHLLPGEDPTGSPTGVVDPSYFIATMTTTYQEDSDVTNASYDGNAMMEWPLIWYKFESLENKGYRAVEYLKSTGTQIIITDIQLDYTKKVEMDCAFGSLIHSTSTSTSNMVMFGVTRRNASSDDALYYVYNYGGGSAGQTSTIAEVVYYIGFKWYDGITESTIHNADLSKRVLMKAARPTSYWGDKSVTVNNTVIATGSDNIAIFGQRWADTGDKYPYAYRDMTVYSFKVYDANDVLLSNLIPVERISDNELGLYDIITNKFYNNAGTGTFEKGNYVDGYGFFYCSDKQVDSSYNCWCNYDSHNNIIPYFYTAIYNVTGTNKARSLSGIALTPENGNGNTTAADERDRAVANNITSAIEWYTEVFADRMLISALLILISKSLDNQSSFGRGIDTGGQTAKESYVTGTLNNKGLFWGDTVNGSSAVKVFGMENFWGCLMHRVAGLVGGPNGTYKYKLTCNTADGSEAVGYNTIGDYYLITDGFRPDSHGYPTKMSFGKYGMLPKALGGSSTTFYSVYFYTGTECALFGDNSTVGLNAGSLSMNLVTGQNITSTYIEGSLSCKPIKNN